LWFTDVKAGKKQAVYGFGECVEDLGMQWSECVEQSGAAVESPIHVVCDGVPWITQQAEQCLGQNVTATLDFFTLATTCHPVSSHRLLLTKVIGLKAGNNR